MAFFGFAPRRAFAPLLVLMMACSAACTLCCRSSVAPPAVSVAETWRPPEPSLEQRKRHCASMGQEFATGHVYALDLSQADSEPERIATVPGDIRLAEDLMVFEDDAIAVGGYKGLTWFGSDRVARFLPAPEDGYTQQLLPFDMDADGDLDLLVLHEYEVVDRTRNMSTSFGRPVVWLREGDELRRKHALSTAGYVNLSDLNLLDIEGNAAAELLVLGPRHIEFVRTHADGKAERAPLGPIPLSMQHLAIGTGDINGDGLRELFVLSAHHQAQQNNVRVIFAKAGGGYGKVVDSALSAFFGRHSGFYDFTGDGIPDLAQTGLNPTARTWFVDLWLGRSDGRFSEPRRVAEGLGGDPDLLAFDYDADGTHELVLWTPAFKIFDLRESTPRIVLERELPYPHARRLQRSAKTGHVSAYWVLQGCDGHAMY